MKKLFICVIIIACTLSACRSKKSFNAEDFTLSTVTSQLDTRPNITYEASGDGALKKFIMANLEYSHRLIGDNLNGTALLDVVIGGDGRVADVKIIEASGNEKYDEELLRIVSVLPRWIMGRPADKYLHHRYKLKVTYKVDGEDDAVEAAFQGKIKFKK